MEFKEKEADFGGFPKGLIWGLNLMGAWIYNEENPFASLETNRIFDLLREMCIRDRYEPIAL